MTEPELVFHDTVPLPEEELPKARGIASQQKMVILNYFRQRFSMNFTPMEVYEYLNTHVSSTILLTSVRRSITDLTKEGRLIKCMWSESKMGAYGKMNRTWRYNASFVRRLNPQK